AGTSAGAINTMLLAATRYKEEEKTEIIIKDLLELEMFSFVDGKPSNSRFTKWIKRVIQQFVLKKNYVKRLSTSIGVIIGLMVLFSLASIIMSIIFWNVWVQAVAILALVFWLAIIVLIIFLVRRFK